VREIIPDEPLLPSEPPKPRGGRPRVSDRAALSGLLYVLKTGISWRMLPKEFGYSGGNLPIESAIYRPTKAGGRKQPALLSTTSKQTELDGRDAAHGPALKPSRGHAPL
jgi:hypothetical protein